MHGSCTGANKPPCGQEGQRAPVKRIYPPTPCHRTIDHLNNSKFNKDWKLAVVVRMNARLHARFLYWPEKTTAAFALQEREREMMKELKAMTDQTWLNWRCDQFVPLLKFPLQNAYDSFRASAFIRPYHTVDVIQWIVRSGSTVRGPATVAGLLNRWKKRFVIICCKELQIPCLPVQSAVGYTAGICKAKTRRGSFSSHLKRREQILGTSLQRRSTQRQPKRSRHDSTCFKSC